ncbi:MAG: hypothetical protein JSR46_04400 [Verrucomicrobia bacterium]|nr:hypothetical protein [Verrucomicrobiota bacterium]
MVKEVHLQLPSIQSYLPTLPTPREAFVGTLAVVSAYYFRGISGVIAVVAAYSIYRCASTNCPAAQRRITVEKNIRTEFFKRLPKALKSEILNQAPISSEAIAELREEKLDLRDIERLRKIAISACLEEKIDKKELTYIMLSCMVQEMKNKLPGITFDSTYGKSKASLERIVDMFCSCVHIQSHVLGNPASREDAFFVIQRSERLDSRKEYHHTAYIAQTAYPFSFNNGRTLYVFPPHTFENLLVYRYRNPERPLVALGTRSIEKFSDNTHRILSITGGTTVPTPNIESNEALSLPFYLHDCYHLDLDSAMGSDRVFWNAFGSYFLNCSKQAEDSNMKKAFQTLGQFCLDKEFESYKHLPVNEAFLVPLIGLYEIAGKEQVDDKEEPFQCIVDASFVKIVQKSFFHHLKLFLQEHTATLNLRADLSLQGVLESLNSNNEDLKDFNLILNELKTHLQ